MKGMFCLFIFFAALGVMISCSSSDDDDDNDNDDHDTGDDDDDSLPLGRVFAINPDEGAPVDMPLTGLPDEATLLSGENFAVFTCMGADCFSDVEQLATADANGDFLYDPLVDPQLGDDPAAEVNIYYHAQQVLERFAQLGFGGLADPVNIIVRFGFDENGDDMPDDFLAGATELWGAPGLLFGCWGERNLAYDPDILGHELTHIVTATVNALDTTLGATGFNTAPAAVNEGSADFFSCSINGDPDVGEYSAAALGYPYMSSVDNGATCPAALYGEPHVDGQIWSGALWELHAALGAETAEQVAYDTLAELPTGFSLQDAARALLAVCDAAGCGDEAETILQARGLLDCACQVDLSIGEQAELWVPSVDEEVWDDAHENLYFLDALPAPLPIRVDVPAETSSLTLTVSVPAGEEIDLANVTVHLRFDEAVQYALAGGELQTTADAAFPATAPITLSAASDPPLSTGYVYLSFVHAGAQDGSVIVAATQP
ncbi:MAG TPA: hypothetical protein PKW95_15250 [bacterium]|nr:hypothetical protein [bacterium]